MAVGTTGTGARYRWDADLYPHAQGDAYAMRCLDTIRRIDRYEGQPAQIPADLLRVANVSPMASDPASPRVLQEIEDALGTLDLSDDSEQESQQDVGAAFDLPPAGMAVPMPDGLLAPSVSELEVLREARFQKPMVPRTETLKTAAAILDDEQSEATVESELLTGMIGGPSGGQEDSSNG